MGMGTPGVCALLRPGHSYIPQQSSSEQPLRLKPLRGHFEARPALGEEGPCEKRGFTQVQLTVRFC